MSQDPPSTHGASFPRVHALDSVRAVVLLLGVVLHATAGVAGPTGAFTEIHRSVPGDPRGSGE